MKKIIFSLGLLILFCGGIYIWTRLANQTKQIEPEELSVGLQQQPSIALILIAQKEGFFTDESLSVIQKNFSTGRDALADTLAGKTDIAAVGETPVVRSFYEGQKVRILSTLYTSTQNTALLARKDRGIMRIDDIRGKKIAVQKNTTGEFFLFSYLTSQGVPLSAVTLVDVDASHIQEMLIHKTVDAAVVLDPYLFTIKQAFPANSLSIFQSNVYTNISVLAGREDRIKEKKEAILRFLRALVRAEIFYTQNKEAATKIVIAAFPTLPQDSVRESLRDVTPETRLNNVLLSILTREADWFRTQDIYHTQPPQYRDSLFTSYLIEVKPEEVTIY